MSKEKEIKSLARRFSLEQWNHLCTKPDFLKLLDEGEIESAKFLAHKITTQLHGINQIEDVSDEEIAKRAAGGLA